MARAARRRSCRSRREFAGASPQPCRCYPRPSGWIERYTTYRAWGSVPTSSRMCESGTPVHSAIYVQPSSQPIIVICVLGGKALEFSKRERRRAGDHAINDQPPVHKRRLLKALEFFAQGIDRICKRIFGDLAVRKLTRQSMASQYSLRSIGECFARAVNASRIRRDESISSAQALQLRPSRKHPRPPRARW